MEEMIQQATNLPSPTGLTEVMPTAELKISPLRNYYYDDGRVFSLSSREEAVVDEWCKSFNTESCRRVLKEQFGWEVSRKKIQQILGRGRVKWVVNKGIEVQAMIKGYKIGDRDSWLALGYKLMLDKNGTPNKDTSSLYKELGKSQGFYVDGDKPQFSQQINITQSDGRV